MEIRQIEKADATPLMQFYNGLSQASKRTFRPLGEQTTPVVCEKIIAENNAPGNKKFDLVASENGQIIGWSFLWGLNEPAPTFGIGIADAFQCQGLGKQLMDAILEYARNSNIPRIILTVVQENQIAWRMYQRRGFQITGEFLDTDGLMYFRMTAELKKEA
jgi:ribosomal protein S18 acetylase RimI-like enzyme